MNGINKLNKLNTLLESMDNRLEESSNKDSFLNYELKAHEMFLKSVAAGVKKVARSYAEQVKIVNTGRVVWLEYKGQNHSDMDMSFLLHIFSMPSGISLNWECDSVQWGKTKDDIKKHTSQITVQLCVDIFERCFNA